MNVCYKCPYEACNSSRTNTHSTPLGNGDNYNTFYQNKQKDLCSRCTLNKPSIDIGIKKTDEYGIRVSKKEEFDKLVFERSKRNPFDPPVPRREVYDKPVFELKREIYETIERRLKW